MAIHPCIFSVDESGRELVAHGTTAFPIACYHDVFRESDVPWHWHQELETAVITAGSCTVAAGNQKFTLRAGQGFFINSGILHGAWDVAQTGCELHSLVFHSRLVGGSLDSVFHQEYVQPILDHPGLEIVLLSPDVPWQASALEAIAEAWSLCQQEEDGYVFGVRSALSRLIWRLHSHMPLQPARSQGKANRDAERIKAMLSFIHANFGTGLTTRTIAASAMVSESECLRCFRKTIGTTPIQYVKQYRIQQAAQLLSATNDKIADIAVQCGFQDMSYFTRAFREYKNCTPTEYRKNGR